MRPPVADWKKVRQVVEEGLSLTRAAELFGIKKDTIRAKSLREKWATPRRKSKEIQKALVEHTNRVAGSQDHRVAANEVLEEQLREAAGESPSGDIDRRVAPVNSREVAGLVDFEKAAQDYRAKGVQKLGMLLDNAILAPPRTYKDLDIADKMMRRLLGLDDGESKANTVVQLQVVNERLRTSLPDDIIEGEMVDESVTNPSPSEAEQSEVAGC